MKCKLLLLALSFFFSINLFGQGLIILDPDGNDITGDTLKVNGDANEDLIHAYIRIHNDSETLMQILARKVEIDTLPGTFNTFCWNGACFPPFVYETETPLLLEPGETSASDDFYGEYAPEGQEGISIIEYEFFSHDDGFETVKTTVIYDTEDTETYTQSPGDVQWSVSDPFPNPARNVVTFNHTIPHGTREAFILIQSITGATLKHIAIDPIRTNTQIDISNLKPGFYLYTFQMNGQPVAAGKIIITH